MITRLRRDLPIKTRLALVMLDHSMEERPMMPADERADLLLQILSEAGLAIIDKEPS